MLNWLFNKSKPKLPARYKREINITDVDDNVYMVTEEDYHFDWGNSLGGIEVVNSFYRLWDHIKLMNYFF